MAAKSFPARTDTMARKERSEPEIHLAFRGMDASPAVTELVQERARKLTRFYDRIVEIHVVVEGPPRHHQHGGHFRVRVDLSIPGEDVHVGREPAERNKHDDVIVAVGHAFDAARRRLQDHVRKSRGRKTTIETAPPEVPEPVLR